MLCRQRDSRDLEGHRQWLIHSISDTSLKRASHYASTTSVAFQSILRGEILDKRELSYRWRYERFWQRICGNVGMTQACPKRSLRIARASTALMLVHWSGANSPRVSRCLINWRPRFVSRRPICFCASRFRFLQAPTIRHYEPRPAVPGGVCAAGGQSPVLPLGRVQMRLKVLPSSSSNRLA
jgi:hypothetical protein